MPPLHTPPPDDALLGRYVAGHATTDERLRVLAWLEDDPSRRALLADVERAWAVSPMDHTATDADAARVWASVRDRTIHRATGLPTPRDASRAPASPRSWSRMPRIGIVLAGAAFASVALGALGVLAHHTFSARTPDATNQRVYATTVGQRATLTLADGSRVTLAPQTRLTVPSDFGATRRTIALVGEAYFDVTPHRTPFIVQSGTVRTNVLGTRFVVTHYSDDRDVRVAVASGKVSVTAMTAKRPSVVLTAGTVGRVTDSTATASTAEDVSVYTDWVNGRMRVYNASVPELLRAFEHWYGYQFRLTDSTLARGRYTTTFDGMTPAEALTALKRLLNVTMTFEGHVVSLHAAGLPEPRRRNRETEPTPLREVGR
jgi:ferric-dicitrate binding protein FerR (iron transport regulator)